ncbi:hypothetical protein [Microbacterium sp. SORGH_AS_0421]|uniref:hypothetical protein n=1 Tax=Microbacterium sp. SORGH_AS_0421 TaxID=3041768 RepID=UPI001AE463C6|nr:hypothetical protein [Microbacterium sp. SORGH_AS_0421]MDQ1176324.1 hypothetical protein [Microbacterium sp. SORGH_AS_0421]
MTYRVVNVRRATADELAARKRLKEMAANQLPSVRSAAEKWRNGVGLSGGAITVAGLIAAPEIVKDATATQLQQGVWLLGAAVGLVLVAMACGLRASFGWPALRNIATADALREWELREVTRSIWYLRASMIVSIGAVVVIALAGAVLLFGLDLATFHLTEPAPAPTP